MLTDLATAKSHLGILASDTSQDTRITTYVDIASSRISEHCNRTFDLTSYVEFFDGRSQNELLLSQYPVTTFNDLRVDHERVFGADTIVDAEDYYINQGTGIIRFHKTILLHGSKVVRADYEAGFATIPSVVEHAALLFIEYLYHHRSDRRIGVSDKSKQGESVTYSAGIPTEIFEILEPYVKHGGGWSQVGVLNI